MAASNYYESIHDSSHFLESAGCILFDFRGTGFDPLKDTQTHTTSTESVSTTLTQPQLIMEPKVVLFYSQSRQVYLLPKGRRNIGESRKDTAIRETFEEVGLKCSLLPVTLQSRATSTNPSDDRTNKDGYTIDEPRPFRGSIDPFTLVVRQTRGKGARKLEGDLPRHAPPIQSEEEEDVVKLIWWFVGIVDNDQGTEQEQKDRMIDPGCEIVSVPLSQAVERCTYQGDREVVAKAAGIVRETFQV